MPEKLTIKEKVSRILIEWSMPTRQAAINDIIKAVQKDTCDQIQQELIEYKILHPDATINDAVGVVIGVTFTRSITSEDLTS